MMNKILNKLYFLYLGLLPAVSTYILMQNLPNSDDLWILVFFIWIWVVWVYLTMINSYTKIIENYWLLSIIFLDWIFISFLWNIEYSSFSLNNIYSLNINNFITENFLIENTAIWLSILVLAIFSWRPSRWELIASVILSIIFLSSIFALYYVTWFFEEKNIYYSLIMWILVTFFIKYKILHEDKVIKWRWDNMMFVITCLFAWIFSVFLGWII